MVEQITLLWIGSVALATTFGGLRMSVPAYKQGESSLSGLIAYGIGLLFWALFTIHANGYILTLGSGVAQRMSTASFTIAGLIGGVLCLILLFDAAARAIGFSL